MLLPPPSRGPHKMYILRGAPFGLSSPVQNVLSYSQNAGLTIYEYQNFWYRTHITKRRTVLTEIPARAEEFGARTLTPVSA